jgi:nicotine blue oxidoreductase
MIAGIVLAGGASRRMAQAKALLKAGEETFLERAIRILRAGGCEEVVVVLNEPDAQVSDLTSGAGGLSAPGAGSHSEQIDSLRAGLRALPREAEAVVVMPVDHPLVRPTTVALLIGAYRSARPAIVRAVYRGRHGHPVLFASSIFEELLHGPRSEGARSVIRAHQESTAEVEVDDRGVVIDVDTPEDYEKYIGDLR